MKIAIAGYGVEGEQNYDYFSALGHDITIVDEREQPSHSLPEGVLTILGEDVFQGYLINSFYEKLKQC